MVFDPISKIIGNQKRIVKDMYGKNEKRETLCDNCGDKSGKYYNKKSNSYMCEDCMQNHLYEGFNDKGWVVR